MVVEYGIELDDFIYDKLDDFFDEFIDEFEVDALFVFAHWVLDTIEIKIEQAQKVIKIKRELEQMYRRKNQEIKKGQRRFENIRKMNGN